MISAMQRRNYGLVLGGGGARGLAHLGVIEVLERENLLPNVVAGTSMGGLVGAFVAAGYSAQELHTIARSVSLRRLLDWRVGTGLLSDSAFRAWMAQHLPPTFEELALPLVVTATDIISGRTVYLSRGDLYSAIRATIAYPGAIDPVAMNDTLLLDGGILNQVPVDAAIFLGASRTLAVDVTAPEPLELSEKVLPGFTTLPVPLPQWWRDLTHKDEVSVSGKEHSDSHRATHGTPASLGTVQALRRSVDIMQAQLTAARLSLYRPNVLLRPHLHGIDLSSFRRAPQAIQAGQQAAEKELAQLHEVFGGLSLEPPK